MKKFFSIILCISMIFTLSSCGGASPAADSGQAGQNQGQSAQSGQDGTVDPGIEVTPAEPFEPKGRLSNVELRYQNKEADTVFFEISFQNEQFYDSETDSEDEYSYLSMLVTDPRNGTVERWLSADLTYRGFDELEESILGSGILNYAGYKAENPNDADNFLHMSFTYDEDEIATADVVGVACYPDGFVDAIYALVDECYDYCGFATSGYTNFVPNVDSFASERMSNAKWGSWYAQDNIYELYGFAFNSDSVGSTYRINLYGDEEPILDGTVPMGMQYDGTSNCIYFIDAQDANSLYRYDINTGALKRLFQNVYEYAACGGKLYFVDTDDYKLRVCDPSVDLNAQVLMDKFVEEPYVLGDWLVYVLVENGESIHAYNLKTKEDITLNSELSKCVNIRDNMVYYLNRDNCICTINLVTGEKDSYSDIKTGGAFLMAGDYIYFYDQGRGGELVSMNRYHMSTVEDPGFPFDSCYSLGSDKELHGAFDMSIIFAQLDKDGYIEELDRMYNYFDGGMDFWLEF